MANIAVLGAGLMGRFMALVLKGHHQVCLFEKGLLSSADATGRIAAAMMAPTSESVKASRDITNMGRASLSLWPLLLRHLNLDIQIQNKGTLVLAHRQDEGDLRQFMRLIEATEQSTEKGYQSLDRAAILNLEPELSHTFHHGLYIPDEAHIDNVRLFALLDEKLNNSPIDIQQNTHVELTEDAVLVRGQARQFDWIIDCRGIGARHEMCHPHSQLRGVRGEVIRLRAPEVTLHRQIRLMHPRYPLYIVPKGEHQFVIGATEIESDNNKGVTVRSCLELLSAAYSLHSGFAESEILSMQAGLRPTLADNEPQIVVKPGTMQINGLYRHGFLIAPYILAKAIEVLNHRGLMINSPFHSPALVTEANTDKLVIQLND